jgi:large conductance mechanosensitive channel
MKSSFEKLGAEFKTFIMRGNVLDLAVGVIIGAAFGKIVSSLVADILMPIIGAISGGINFSSLSIDFGKAHISYGSFIQTLIDFIIVAFCIFILVKFVNTIAKKKKTPEEVKVVKSSEEKILEEIRDLLKANKKKS